MLIELYTRPQCQLCTEALTLLTIFQEDLGYTIQTNDISTNEQWTQTYGLQIPVIVYQDQILAEGQIDIHLLRKRLHEMSR